jgi:hypothetical protein
MAAIGLAVLGLIAGILFQLRGLLWIVPLLFIASIGFAITREYGFLKTVFTVFAAQTRSSQREPRRELVKAMRGA